MPQDTPDRRGKFRKLINSLAAHRNLVFADLRELDAGELAAHVELDVSVAHQKGLGICVDGDELDTAQAQFDHAVDSVNAAAADADDLDHGEVVLVRGHVEAFRSTFTLR